MALSCIVLSVDCVAQDDVLFLGLYLQSLFCKRPVDLTKFVS